MDGWMHGLLDGWRWYMRESEVNGVPSGSGLWLGFRVWGLGVDQGFDVGSKLVTLFLG